MKRKPAFNVHPGVGFFAILGVLLAACSGAQAGPSSGAPAAPSANTNPTLPAQGPAFPGVHAAELLPTPAEGKTAVPWYGHISGALVTMSPSPPPTEQPFGCSEFTHYGGGGGTAEFANNYQREDIQLEDGIGVAITKFASAELAAQHLKDLESNAKMCAATLTSSSRPDSLKYKIMSPDTKPSYETWIRFRMGNVEAAIGSSYLSGFQDKIVTDMADVVAAKLKAAATVP